MKEFDNLPKNVKKTLRYISQDVRSLEKLAEVQFLVNKQINKRREELYLLKSQNKEWL
ncbi:LytR family transcriptional regulator [Peribacillus sp. SCS-155]|uniref:LytR family transcriptional regulator n=1 Tax=Peribacillus sedimenti TaxID=3115297 RepID=UPI0039059D5D